MLDATLLIATIINVKDNWFEILVKSPGACFPPLPGLNFGLGHRTEQLSQSKYCSWVWRWTRTGWAQLTGKDGPCAGEFAPWLRAQAAQKAPGVPIWILQSKMLWKVLVFLLSFRNCQLEGEDLLLQWSRFIRKSDTFLCSPLLCFCKGFPAFHDCQLLCCRSF